MTPQTLIFATVALVILLPIIPAYLLFKFLPAGADVTGPFKGLQLKLGGAFAGYFILVVLILSQLSRIKDVMKNPPAPPVVASDQVWRVEGQIVDEHGDPIQPLDATDIQLMPRSLDLGANGNFAMTIVTARLPAGNRLSFPKLTLTHDGYSSTTVSLDPVGPQADLLERDDNTHLFVLKPVKLSAMKIPAYSTTGTPPEAVADPAYPKH